LAVFASAVLPVKVPPPLEYIDVKTLPSQGYLQATVAPVVTSALSEISAPSRTPLVYPGLSSRASLALVLALKMKLANAETDFAREKLVQAISQFEEACHIATRITEIYPGIDCTAFVRHDK